MTIGTSQGELLLQEARSGGLSLAELFPRLAAQVPAYFSAFSVPQEEGGLPQPDLVADSGGGELAILFTDRASAAPLLGDGIGRLQSYPALQALQWLIRAASKGVVMNPGTADLALDQRGLRLLFREYALLHLSQEGGAWVPTKDDSLMVLEVVEGVYTVPVYLGEVDATPLATRTASQAKWHRWDRIQERSLEAGTDGVFLQYGYREQAGLPRPLVTRLTGQAVPDPLEMVEQALSESKGVVMPADLWPHLAKLDRVWTLVDKDGDIVSLGPTLDLFTSLGALETFREQVRAQNPDLAIFPRFLTAQALFHLVADRRLQVSINRGMEHFWVDALQGLPVIIGTVAGAPTSQANPQDNSQSWLRRLFRKK